jgi:hypothetical protein
MEKASVLSKVGSFMVARYRTGVSTSLSSGEVRPAARNASPG